MPRFHRTALLILFAAVPVLVSPGVAPSWASQDGAQARSADVPFNDRYAWEENERVKRKSQALEELKRAPDEPATVRALFDADRFDEAFAAVERIIDRHPERIPRMIELLDRQLLGWSFRFYEDRNADYPALLEKLMRRAEARLGLLPREEAARTAYRLSTRRGSPESMKERRAAVVRDYLGTDAAQLAEVEGLERGEQRQRYARDHPGTAGAAYALYLHGFDLANNPPPPARDGSPRDDPAARFFQVLEIATDLESGRYPESEWTRKAFELVAQFNAPRDAKWPRDQLEALLAAHWDFARRHFSPADSDPEWSAVGSVIGYRIPLLYSSYPDGVARYEAALESFVKQLPDPAAGRYLQAMIYGNPMGDRPPAGQPGKAIPLLKTLAHGADTAYRGRALAAMAWLQLYHRELASAEETFGRYLALYPAAPYAWLAAVRMGQAAMLQGHWAKAVSAFELAAGYTGEPLARVHARVLAGKAYEAAGEPAKARDAYRASLASWTSDVPSYSWGGQKPVLKRKADEDGLMPDDSGRFTKADIVKRLAWLDAVLALPAGTDLARARWLLEQERYEEARALADRCLNATTKSSRTAGEARALSRRARLELALLQADVGREGSDHAKALRSLEILSRNTMDAPGLTARIAHACLLRKQGRGADAAQALTLALADWQRTQRQSPEIRRTLSALEQDVADIRALVFRPAGDREFKDTRWNGFAWPLSLPAFVVVAPEVEVVHADRTVETLSVHQLFVDLPNALFFDQEQITLLNTLMKRLGGTARMTPRNPMAVPNQPVGPSVDIRAFLSEAFPVIPGHWGGWHFDTFPTITRIEFHDAERSRAVARLVVGYGGADALLEKQDGKWRLVEVRRTWIT